MQVLFILALNNLIGCLVRALKIIKDLIICFFNDVLVVVCSAAFECLNVLIANLQNVMKLFFTSNCSNLEIL
jgi:hypothetical protein